MTYCVIAKMTRQVLGLWSFGAPMEWKLAFSCILKLNFTRIFYSLKKLCVKSPNVMTVTMKRQITCLGLSEVC